MPDGPVLLVALAAALTYFAATGIVHGAKKLGHGVKTVACKVHLAHCEQAAKK